MQLLIMQQCYKTLITVGMGFLAELQLPSQDSFRRQKWPPLISTHLTLSDGVAYWNVAEP
jgi:hypothetical protein